MRSTCPNILFCTHLEIRRAFSKQSGASTMNVRGRSPQREKSQVSPPGRAMSKQKVVAETQQILLSGMPLQMACWKQAQQLQEDTRASPAGLGPMTTMQTGKLSWWQGQHLIYMWHNIKHTQRKQQPPYWNTFRSSILITPITFLCVGIIITFLISTKKKYFILKS